MSKKIKQSAVDCWAIGAPQFQGARPLTGVAPKRPTSGSGPGERLDVTDWKKELVVAISAQRKAEEKIRCQEKQIDDLQTTISVLLRRKREDEMLLEDSVTSNIRKLVWPFVRCLRRTKLTAVQARCLRNIETNLNDILSPLAERMTTRAKDLTEGELVVAKYVWLGMSTSEISELLNLPEGSVIRHCATILKKMGVNGHRGELREVLSNLDPRFSSPLNCLQMEEKS